MTPTSRGRQVRSTRHYREQRRALLANAERCFWCKIEISDALPPNHPQKATADHLLALALGGEDSLANLVPACRKCNLKRGTKSSPNAPAFRVEEF